MRKYIVMRRLNQKSKSRVRQVSKAIQAGREAGADPSSHVVRDCPYMFDQGLRSAWTEAYKTEAWRRESREELKEKRRKEFA